MALERLFAPSSDGDTDPSPSAWSPRKAKLSFYAPSFSCQTPQNATSTIRPATSQKWKGKVSGQSLSGSDWLSLYNALPGYCLLSMQGCPSKLNCRLTQTKPFTERPLHLPRTVMTDLFGSFWAQLRISRLSNLLSSAGSDGGVT